MDYLIISKDKRLPLDVPNDSEYEIILPDKFLEMAYNSEIPEVNYNFLYDISCLPQDVYETLSDNNFTEEFGGIYYHFSDVPVSLSFEIKEGYVEYDVGEPEPKTEIPPKKEQEIKEETPPIIEKVEPPKPVAVKTNPLKDYSITEDKRVENLLNMDEMPEDKGNLHSAEVILFGSSKGGTGKTFTCLLSTYRFARQHSNLRIALADFDIIDGQIGVTIHKNSPTFYDYYKRYKNGDKSWESLENFSVKNSHFSPNVDFYLAPPRDIPEVTNDTDFWNNIFELLITHYDVVFFDSGIDYLGKPPITKLYDLAGKIILTSNPSINSVKSIIRQLRVLGGIDKNNFFKIEDKILKKVNVVLTRTGKNEDFNKIARNNIGNYAPVIAEFGNLDELISQTQWYQDWELWDNYPEILEVLDTITELPNA